MFSDVIAFTDGSAVVKGERAGNGGYGIYFSRFFDLKDQAIRRGFLDTKTGRMEVRAVLKLLQIVFRECRKRDDEVYLQIYSDSQYVVKTFTENRLQKWKVNGWKNTSGEVKNKDLWILIDLLLLKNKPYIYKIEFNHIKSHQVDKLSKEDREKIFKENPLVLGNYMADKLADYKTQPILIKDKYEIINGKFITE